MFDREKQVIINRYCRAIFDASDKISVSEILNLNIPDSIKHYIRLEIERRVEEEFSAIRNFSKFNFDHIKVKPLVDELKILLTLTKELNINELSILLKFALDLNLDYLLKPCDTLTSFIMKYEEFQSVSFIRDRLKFIVEYEYFPILVNKYFEKTGLNKIGKNDFQNLLHKIDKEYTRDFTLLDHYNLFSRFKNFLFELNLSITDSAEYEAFIIYLKDKQRNELASFLEEHREQFKTSGGTVVSFIRSILHSSVYEKQVVETKSLAEDMVVEEENKSLEKISNEEVVKEGSESVTFEENYESYVQKENFKEVLNNSENVSPELSIQNNENNFEQNAVKKEESSQKLYNRNLDGLMPKSLRKKIIKKIFDENEIEFIEFMEKLNAVNNWDEASLLLTDLFDRKNIQPLSKWANKFAEFLYENIK
ncbi:MAG: hypothetical protein NUV92_02660 [Ignavibacteria bacterium]|jgi:hypothetical protein|nr:hypothetical protein [Ignavibacteria bacterium]MDH7527136.1 hypothetical protein [Ignavibacteria bacterium]